MTVVAIDGPAAAGKSTVARRVADALGFTYVDTGAMYRAVALVALERGIAADAGGELERLAQELPLEITRDGVRVEGRDVSARIREADVTAAVPGVSAVAGVRRALVNLQREIAVRGGVVMEGRDIGATVAPDAEVKVFLTASLEERASRRGDQLGLPSDPATLRGLRASLEARDEADATRTESPLTMTAGALVVDSTDRDVAEVVAMILDAVEHAGK